MDITNHKNTIKKLEKKANMTRDMHAYQFQKYSRIFNIFSLFIIVFSAIVSILAVADEEVLFLNDYNINHFRNLIAILAFCIFLLSLIDKIFGINEKVTKHEQAVKVLTDFVTECNKFRNLDTDSCSEEELNLKIDSLHAQYSLINQMNPFATFSDGEFLKAKKKHLLKVEISTKISENPSKDIGKFVNKRYFTRFAKWIFGLFF